MSEIDLLIKNARQLITLSSSVKDPSGLGVIPDGAVAIKGGKILWIGATDQLPGEFALGKEGKEVDAREKVVLPGLIDSHTHLVFAGSRENEFEMRIQGLSYLEIAERGGGILSTVEATRRASFEELFLLGKRRLNRWLSMGVTTLEAKSGYGLSYEDELKILKVIRALQKEHPIEIIPTFLGAHTIPGEYRKRREEYLNLLINELIPEVARQGLAEFCDVFCEEKAFSLEESRKILETGKRYGLKPKIHADQLTPGGGAELAAEMGAYSADHLEYISPKGILLLAEKGVVAGLLPGCSFFLRMERLPPAREMIEKGVPIALATDFNPGSSMTESLPLIMTMGCLLYRMTPSEAIRAVTLNAAKSIDKEGRIGTLDPGKQADIVILDIPNYKYLPYHFGVNHTQYVIKKGEIVYQRKEESFDHRSYKYHRHRDSM